MTLDHAGAIEVKRENIAELFAGVQPQVNHLLTHRTLMFRNPNNVPIEIDLKCQAMKASPSAIGLYKVQVMSALLNLNFNRFYVAAERAWLAATISRRRTLYCPLTKIFISMLRWAIRRRIRAPKAVGWAFPALFHVPDAETWVLLTESGTDGLHAACHLGPDSTGGLYRIAFPWPMKTTGGYTNKFGPEPRYVALPWAMPWRVIVLGKSARATSPRKRSSPISRHPRVLPIHHG